MTVYCEVISLRSQKPYGRCMKNKRFALTRVVAGVTATALLAACGTGSESSDTTERTRNSISGWTATTEPTKAVVFGTQDGLVEWVDVPASSSKVSSFNMYTAPASAMGNTISMVAFDSARSEIVFGGNTPTSGVFVSRKNFEDATPIAVYSAGSGFMYGGGYDSSSRVAVFAYSNLGSPTYVINSVDETGSPMLQSTVPFFPIAHYDGSRALLTTGSNIREIAVTNPASTIASTPDIATTPFDMWGFVKDPLSDAVYGARHNSGEILKGNLDGSTGTFLEVGRVVNPSSLAAFSDGTLVAGTGAAAVATAPVEGALTVVDPTGKVANIDIGGIGSGASTSGVQSVWAVESPIATAPPTVSVDASGNLVCSDATWRGDLPLSRLSRAPVESARTYGWFIEGKEISGEMSETLITEDSGNFSCAVIAYNGAGVGYSAQSAPLAYVPPAPTTTVAPVEDTTTVPGAGDATTTTVEASGGSDSMPAESPVVTVPAVTPGAPVAVVTPSLRSAKWTFKGRTVKVTFRKYSGAKKYRLYVSGATKKTIACKTGKTTVTCTTTTLKKGVNSFSAKALSTSNVTLAVSTKTRITK